MTFSSCGISTAEVPIADVSSSNCKFFQTRNAAIGTTARAITGPNVNNDASLSSVKVFDFETIGSTTLASLVDIVISVSRTLLGILSEISDLRLSSGSDIIIRERTLRLMFAVAREIASW